MLLDWFTIVAQVVNFLILVWLLKHFLYDKILRAMDDREKRVQERMEEAEDKSRQAREEARSYEEKTREIEEKRQEMLEQAKREAEEKRREMMEKARKEVEAQREQWEESVRNQREAFLRDLRKRIADQVFEISARALRDLGDQAVEERIGERFLEEMEHMAGEERDSVVASVQKDENRLSVRSSFELSGNLRGRITRRIHEMFAKDADVLYETDDELIAGIELKVPGVKVAWSVEQYLESLHEDVARRLEQG